MPTAPGCHSTQSCFVCSSNLGHSAPVLPACGIVTPGPALLAGSHPARGGGQALQELWPLLHIMMPDTWQHVHTAVGELLAHLQHPGMLALAEEVLPDIVKRIQVGGAGLPDAGRWLCSSHCESL